MGHSDLILIAIRGFDYQAEPNRDKELDEGVLADWVVH